MQGLPARADAGSEVVAYIVGHEELGVFRPAIPALGQTNFFFAQRFAVRRAGVLLVRSPVGDVGIDDDQGWPIVRVFEGREGALQHLEIVRVAYPRHVPTVANEAR